MQNIVSLNNMVRIVTIFLHAGNSVLFLFMPVIAKDVAGSILQVGIILSAFSLSQILSEAFFGRHSDKNGDRLVFIRTGLGVCAVVFALHYLATDPITLLVARIAAGIATGMMLPPLLAYTYESNDKKGRVASVISFQALGWLIGIAGAGIANDARLLFFVSAAFFVIGLLFSTRLPKISFEKQIQRGLTKKIIKQYKVMFSSVLLRHIGATAVWSILPILLMEQMGAQLYHVSIVYMANTSMAFLLGTFLIGRLKISNLTKFKIGLFITIFVFVGLYNAHDIVSVIPFMGLVGVSWAFLYVGGNIYLMENSARSTSTGLFGSTIAISSVIGPLVAGVLAFNYDYYAVILFAVVITMAAFATSYFGKEKEYSYSVENTEKSTDHKAK